MKEKILIFGLGKEFDVNKQSIFEKYDVIAYTDNFLFPQNQKLFIHPERIKDFDFDKILICTKKFKDTIKLQLIKHGVEEKKIIDLCVLEKKEEINYKDVLSNIEAYRKNNTDTKFVIDENNLKIVIKDRYENAGMISPHYFAQDILVAKKILKAAPEEHFDIGSRLEGFISHLLVYRDVNYIDIRPLPCNVPGLKFVQADATNLESIADKTIQSLSSLHAIEHFGLGRYGDQIDPDAYNKVINSIQRVVAPKGHVYIGVPVGPKDRLVFNAHRIFTIETILSLFDKMKLVDLRIIKDNNAYAEEILEKDYGNIPDYSCCVFEFEKM